MMKPNYSYHFFIYHFLINGRIDRIIQGDSRSCYCEDPYCMTTWLTYLIDYSFQVLRVGQKNKHMAATKLNQNSSRR